MDSPRPAPPQPLPAEIRENSSSPGGSSIAQHLSLRIFMSVSKLTFSHCGEKREKIGLKPVIRISLLRNNCFVLKHLCILFNNFLKFFRFRKGGPGYDQENRTGNLKRFAQNVGHLKCRLRRED